MAAIRPLTTLKLGRFSLKEAQTVWSISIVSFDQEGLKKIKFNTLLDIKMTFLFLLMFKFDQIDNRSEEKVSFSHLFERELQVTFDLNRCD